MRVCLRETRGTGLSPAQRSTLIKGAERAYKTGDYDAFLRKARAMKPVVEADLRQGWDDYAQQPGLSKLIVSTKRAELHFHEWNCPTVWRS
jgi:hypothetical protein